jgi:hypothetical protein
MSQEIINETAQEAVAQTPVQETKEVQPEAGQVTPQETNAVESSIFKTFASEEDFEKTLKSERSKAQAALLKELGIKSIDEGKEFLTKASTYENELETAKVELQRTKEFLALQELGVKEEYKQEALTLAKSQGGDLKESLKSVIAKLPIMSSKVADINFGTDRPKDPEEGTVQKHITNKYPWIKL